jgi:hypothetical protein
MNGCASRCSQRSRSLMTARTPPAPSPFPLPVPAVTRTLCHDAVRFRLQLVLHLHRFHHDDALPARTLSPGCTSVRTMSPGIGARTGFGPCGTGGAPGHGTDRARALIHDLCPHGPAVHVQVPAAVALHGRHDGTDRPSSSRCFTGVPGSVASCAGSTYTVDEHLLTLQFHAEHAPRRSSRGRACQFHYGLHVSRLRKEVETANGTHAVQRRKPPEVARERCRITAHVDDARLPAAASASSTPGAAPPSAD